MLRSFTSNVEYAVWFPWRTAVEMLSTTSANQLRDLRSWESTADVSCLQFGWIWGNSTALASREQNMRRDDERVTSEQSVWRPQVAIYTCWLQTENTWSWLEVELSDVLPAINQINCTYIDLMGLEWGHGVGDINLGWKSAIGLVPSHLTGSPWPAGRGGWLCQDLYSCIFPFCCSVFLITANHSCFCLLKKKQPLTPG